MSLVINFLFTLTCYFYLFPPIGTYGNHMDPSGNNQGSGVPKPALPPKPLPPYVPAPAPDSSGSGSARNNMSAASMGGDHSSHGGGGSSLDDSSITIRGNGQGQPMGQLNSSLSVATHPEEGTSVDDDMPSPGEYYLLRLLSSSFPHNSRTWPNISRF